MANKILIVGGERDGQFMDWIGNRVSINGVDHVFHKYRDPDTGEVVEFYLRNGMSKFVPIRFERLIPPPLEPCK